MNGFAKLQGDKIWWIISGILGLILIAAVTYFFVSNSAEKKETQQKTGGQKQERSQNLNAQGDESVFSNSNLNSSAKTKNTNTQTAFDITGTYRCFLYTVNKASSADGCRLQAAMIFYPDGTYTFSSEEGTYAVEGDQVTLSESKIRGPGTILENGLQIFFEYLYNGKDYEVTYLKLDTSEASDETSGEETPTEEDTSSKQSNEDNTATGNTNMNNASGEENSENETTTEGEPCDPLIPTYAQAGCVEAEEA